MKCGSKLVWPSFDRKVDKVVLDILHSGRVNYWTGDYGRAFEDAFARHLGVRRAVSVSNGSAALELALEALGVGKGDDVVVTPYSFRASATCAARVGARMVFADVGRDHMLCAETIERAMTKRTKAIVVVHLFGQVADMGPIVALAKRRGVFVVEDCAQCLGGEYKGRPVGTVGDVGCFSFCQSKHITSGGEGGMVVARKASVLRAVESLRDHGWDVGSSPKAFGRIGTNSRMTELQSAIGLCELERFESWNLPRRRRLAAAFAKGLAGHPLVRIPPLDTPERRASFWLMPFVLDPSRLSCPVSSFIELMQKKGAPVYKVMWPLMARRPVAASLVPDTIGFWTHPTYTLRDAARALAAFDEAWREKRRRQILV
ncbi:MAG: DegT/DnrJ/EryC1/StrS family aminotransferase [Kiritimatiellae bacterium]|nr:DegT/DnrJ/EryC1/StrS family aminotransferase [Kiritimatiellia bacterium]